MNLKQKIFEIIQPGQGRSWAALAFDWTLTVLILASVASVFAQTFDLTDDVSVALSRFEALASVVFTLEYALRIWTADLLYPSATKVGARIRYMVSGMAIIDLLSILPFWLPMMLPGEFLGMRALRLVRLLRVVKLNRYFDAVKSIADVLAAKKKELIGSMLFVFLLMLVSSLLMYSVEHDAQPAVFRNAFSGLWWAVATLTTVGYGDIYPITVVGRLLGAVIAFSGIAALAIPTGIITAGLTERIERGKNVAKELTRQSQKDDEHDEKLEILTEALQEQRKLLEKLLEEKRGRGEH